MKRNRILGAALAASLALTMGLTACSSKSSETPKATDGTASEAPDVKKIDATASAGTALAPGWAYWSIGDLKIEKGDDGKDKPVATWNADKDGFFVLPGVEGGAAPVFAGGSNIGISAKSKHPDLSKKLLKIIFSPEYQTILAENGLGPANSDYNDKLAAASDELKAASIAAAANSKLTPAAPGWADVESSKLLEELFQKVAEGGDIPALAAEYDGKITPVLNNATKLEQSKTAAVEGPAEITLWVVGGDTPKVARDYLTTTFAKENAGSTLKIVEKGWADITTELNTKLGDPDQTPDVTELGNTQSPTYTNAGGFLDITDQVAGLGGDKLLKPFVEAGLVDGKNYTLPYYYGSRLVWYRKDIWAAAGQKVPTTLAEFGNSVKTIQTANPGDVDGFSGLWLGGQDWRNGISWIFANGGELATFSGGKWTSTLSSEKTLVGLAQLQDLWKNATKAPVDATDEATYENLNDEIG